MLVRDSSLIEWLRNIHADTRQLTTSATANVTSSSSGSGNVFVQPDNPNMTEPGIWVQTDGTGGIVTFWVETGGV